MHDIALMAAQQWASANARMNADPVRFGADVARVYLAAKATARHTGDETATAAALTALSVPVETLQWTAQLSLHLARLKAHSGQEPLPGVLGASE